MPPIPSAQQSPYGTIIARPRRYLTRKEQAARYSKSVKTIERWGADPAMAMPPEYWFGPLPHRAEDELEVWERGRVGAIPDRGTKPASTLAT